MRQLKRIVSLTFVFGIVVCGASSHAQAFVFQDKVATAKSLAHYAMGQVYDLVGFTNRAVLEYEKAAQFDEASYLIHLRLGSDYARLDMLSNSIEELNLAKKLNPEDLQAHYLLALIYSTMKEYELAAEEYEFILQRFAKTEPENIEIYGYLGQLYYSQKKFDQAIEQYEKILELEQENVDVMYLLGSLYIEVKRDRKAMELLERAISVDPSHDGSLNTLGYLYAENEIKLDQAKDLVEKALEIDPENGAYLDSMGWVFYKRGEYEKALEYLMKADAIISDPVIYEHIGDTYYKLNNLDEALTFWKKSIELLPDQENVLEKIRELKDRQASSL